MRRVFLEYMGDSIELPHGETLIGRDIACAMRFNDPSVSRRHVRFIHRQGEVFVEDLGSSNGTLLNGVSLGAAQRLFHGDKLSIGTRLVTVSVVDHSDLDQPATFVLSKLPPPKGARGSSQYAATIPPPMGTDHVVPAVPPLAARRHDRLPIELRVIYVSSELQVEIVSRDLSESGVFVCSTVVEPIGTKCTLTLLIEGSPAVIVRGVVRRVVERIERRDECVGFAVEFMGMDAQQLASLRLLVGRTTDPTRPFDLT